MVADSINDSIGVEFPSKDIFGCSEVAAAMGHVLGKDGCTGEAKDVIFLELPDDSGVHIAKL